MEPGGRSLHGGLKRGSNLAQVMERLRRDLKRGLLLVSPHLDGTTLAVVYSEALPLCFH